MSYSGKFENEEEVETSGSVDVNFQKIQETIDHAIISDPIWNFDDQESKLSNITRIMESRG